MDILKFFRRNNQPDPSDFQKPILESGFEIPAPFNNKIPPKDLFYSEDEPTVELLLPKREYENYSVVTPNQQIQNNQTEGKKMNQIEIRIREFEDFQNRKFFDEGYDHGGRSISFTPLDNGLEALFGKARQLLSLIISISESSIRQFQMVIEMDKENYPYDNEDYYYVRVYKTRPETDTEYNKRIVLENKMKETRRNAYEILKKEFEG